MSVEFFKKSLDSFKRANKERKVVLAKRYGYNSPEEFKNYLESMIAGKKTETSKELPVGNKKIHVIDIIDCSGSMGGPKIHNAIEGINKGIAELKASKEPIEYSYTICEFSDNSDIKFKYTIKPVEEVKPISLSTRSVTALYDATIKTIKTALGVVKNFDSTLINIYTDGGENDSRNGRGSFENYLKVAEEEGIVVTFIGTKGDVESMINSGVKMGNTMSYDGSAQGLQASFQATSSARSVYSAKVLKGEDVSDGFFKDVN